jgi:hypothetical protein
MLLASFRHMSVYDLLVRCSNRDCNFKMLTLADSSHWVLLWILRSLRGKGGGGCARSRSSVAIRHSLCVQLSIARCEGSLAHLVDLGVHKIPHKPVGHVFVLWFTRTPQETLPLSLHTYYLYWKISKNSHQWLAGSLWVKNNMSIEMMPVSHLRRL